MSPRVRGQTSADFLSAHPYWEAFLGPSVHALRGWCWRILVLCWCEWEAENIWTYSLFHVRCVFQALCQAKDAGNWGSEKKGVCALRAAGSPLYLALLKQGWPLGHITTCYLACQRPPLATNIYNRVLWPRTTLAEFLILIFSQGALSPGIICLPTRLPQGLLWVLAHLCEP